MLGGKTLLGRFLDRLDAEDKKQQYSLGAGPRARLVDERCNRLLEDDRFRKDIKKAPRDSNDSYAKLLKKYKLPATYANWVSELITSGKDVDSLRPRDPKTFAQTVLDNLDEIELFELTTQEKKQIQEYLSILISPDKGLTRLRPGESIKNVQNVVLRVKRESRRAKFLYTKELKELAALLERSKNTMRRSRQLKRSTPADASTGLKILLGDRRRQQARRQKLRGQKFVKKSEK